MAKETRVCTECGSTDVWWDATAVWSDEDQMLVLESTFDMTYCNNCDGECSVKDVVLEEKKDEDEQAVYIVQATLIDEVLLHIADADNLEEILTEYEIVAASKDEALDSYHSNIPIKSLESFEITCTKQD
jgi:hypothetical protein